MAAPAHVRRTGFLRLIPPVPLSGYLGVWAYTPYLITGIVGIKIYIDT